MPSSAPGRWAPTQMEGTVEDLHTFGFRAVWDSRNMGGHFYAVTMDGQALKGVTHVHIDTEGEDPIPRITLTFIAAEIAGFPPGEIEPPWTLEQIESERNILARQNYLTAKDMDRLRALECMASKLVEMEGTP